MTGIWRPTWTRHSRMLINYAVVRTAGLLSGLYGSVRIRMRIPRAEKSKSCGSQDNSEIESASSQALILPWREGISFSQYRQIQPSRNAHVSSGTAYKRPATHVFAYKVSHNLKKRIACDFVHVYKFFHLHVSCESCLDVLCMQTDMASLWTELLWYTSAMGSAAVL